MFPKCIIRMNKTRRLYTSSRELSSFVHSNSLEFATNTYNFASLVSLYLI